MAASGSEKSVDNFSADNDERVIQQLRLSNDVYSALRVIGKYFRFDDMAVSQFFDRCPLAGLESLPQHSLEALVSRAVYAERMRFNQRMATFEIEFQLIQLNLDDPQRWLLREALVGGMLRRAIDDLANMPRPPFKVSKYSSAMVNSRIYEFATFSTQSFVLGYGAFNWQTLNYVDSALIPLTLFMAYPYLELTIKYLANKLYFPEWFRSIRILQFVRKFFSRNELMRGVDIDWFTGQLRSGKNPFHGMNENKPLIEQHLAYFKEPIHTRATGLPEVLEIADLTTEPVLDGDDPANRDEFLKIKTSTHNKAVVYRHHSKATHLVAPTSMAAARSAGSVKTSEAREYFQKNYPDRLWLRFPGIDSSAVFLYSRAELESGLSTKHSSIEIWGDPFAEAGEALYTFEQAQPNEEMRVSFSELLAGRYGVGRIPRTKSLASRCIFAMSFWP